MHIAVAQMNSNAGSFEAIFERMLDQASAAQAKGADLICFPAPLLAGMRPGMLSESEEFMADLLEGLNRFAEACPLPALVPVVLDTSMGRYRDVAFVEDGGFLPLGIVQGMRHMGAGELPGTVPMGLEVAGTRLAVALGPDHLAMLAEGEPDPGEAPQVVVYLSGDAFNADDECSSLAPAVSNGHFCDFVRSTGAWLVAVGGVGGYDDEVFCGGSFVLAPWAELAAAAPSCEEAVFDYDIDPYFEGPLPDPVAAGAYDRLSALWEALALGLHDYVEKLGLSGVVVPVTGDITSTCAAVLAVDALGPTKVHAMVLPRHDTFGTTELVRQLVLNLRIGFEDPLSAEIGEYSRLLSEQMEAWGDDRSLTRRLHTDLSNVMLAHRSRELGGCVLGVSDKTGIAVEWTLQACSSAAFEPFGDVYRSDVCALARMRNTISPVIPEELLGRFEVPDDLGLDAIKASDERRLSELDAILYLHIEQNEGRSAIAAENFDEKLVAKVLGRMRKTAVWRASAPLAPAVSDCPLRACDWPVALGWRDRKRDADGSPIDRVLEETSARVLERAFGAGGFDDAGMEEALGMLGDLLSGQMAGEGGAFDPRAFEDGDLPDFPDGSFWSDGLFSQN